MNGDILKELRRENKMTQEELGNKLGVAGSTIRMMELNKRKGSIEVIVSVADFFDVSIDYLEGRTPYKNATDVVTHLIHNLISEKIISSPSELSLDMINDIKLYTKKKHLAI